MKLHHRTRDEIGVLSDLHRRSFESSSRYSVSRDLIVDVCTRFRRNSRPGSTPMASSATDPTWFFSQGASLRIVKMCLGLPTTASSSAHRILSGFGRPSSLLLSVPLSPVSRLPCSVHPLLPALCRPLRHKQCRLPR